MFKASSQNAAACLRCQFCTPRSPKALTTCLLSRVFDLRQNRYNSTAPPSQPGEKDPKLYPVLGVKKSRYQRHVARLDVQTLGEVGEVVILKERASRPNQMTARKFSRILEKETDGDAPWDNPSELLKEVDKSRLQLGDAKEVIENIDTIRGNHEPGDKLDRNEWRKLRTILENGFTANQLTDYHKQFEPPLSSSDQNDGLTGPHSGWRPGTSLFLEMDPEAQKQTASRIGSLGNMAGKIALAEMVLRDCWQLSVSGEIGQLDIHLAPHEIFMLLLPDISPLKDLAITYAAKIDVSRSLNLVRITANESSCELVRQGVVGFFPRIMSRTVDLPNRGFVFHGKNRRFEERFFRSMQKSLNVFCCKDQGTKQIKIYFVSEMEKEADEAYRNIKAAISMTEEDQTRFCTYFPDTESAVLYSVSYQEFLPWADRQRRWLRWMKPLSEAKTPSGTQSEPPPALIRKSRGSAFEKVCNSLFKLPASPTWRSPGQPHIREVIVASLGKSLFAHQQSMKPGKMKFKSFSSTIPRAFATNISNPVSFLQGLPLLPNVGNGSFHRIRLTPSADNKTRLPPIELELDIVSQFIRGRQFLLPILRKAAAVVHRVSMDVLLPETSLDLRFKKFTHYDLLQGRKLSTLSQSEKQRADISSISEVIGNLVWEDAYKQPRIPISCELTIPRKLVIQQQSSAATTADSQGSGEGETDFVTGTYMLPPIRYLRSAQISRFNYKDLELCYSHVHMGPALPEHMIDMSISLGRDDNELRPTLCQPNTHLSSAVAKDKSKGSLQAAFKLFYTRACEMAFEQSAAAANYKERVAAGDELADVTTSVGEDYRPYANLDPEDRFNEWMENGSEGESEDRFNRKVRNGSE
ncbi:conserved hypothetical protein [Histoplasma capsulatum G186AR]|uniref:Respiratory complex assembly protein Rmp1 n=2 Tax=Ajellomyces capsulatus TaxID=5037 RepID=C0NUC5_AJECG|nr:uncharacterized protein HCBG_06956 [Histoplasma capsulatum G186AR]EEH05005.1 conserved hypothetical protein [Histoplasma capsulatum G186AR]KAG5287657.1 respiratory complex assembly protein Rmp1 [Histoplasma capsulatum]QSS70529.1 respiratory complex assembly protein Rmp1 [Histoplasma capsulatum G186AR]